LINQENKRPDCELCGAKEAGWIIYAGKIMCGNCRKVILDAENKVKKEQQEKFFQNISDKFIKPKK